MSTAATDVILTSGPDLGPAPWDGPALRSLPALDDTALPEPEATAARITAPNIVVLYEPPPKAAPRPRFELLQQFEGTVLELDDEGFVASLQDLQNPGAPEEWAEFGFEDVSDDDRKLLAPGAVFYWSLGFTIQPWGQRIRTSTLRFRRVPVWTKRELEAVEQKANEWAHLLEERWTGLSQPSSSLRPRNRSRSRSSGRASASASSYTSAPAPG